MKLNRKPIILPDRSNKALADSHAAAGGETGEINV